MYNLLENLKEKNNIKSISKGLLLKILALLILISCADEITNVNNYSVEEALTDPSVMPVVTYTSPNNNAVGPFDNYMIVERTPKAKFLIQLNKLIDVSSLRSNDIILKSGNETYPINLQDTDFAGNYSGSILRNILVFVSYQTTYKAHKTYTVVVDSTLTDIHENKLNTPYEFSFTPEPDFRVYYSSPTYDQVSVQNFSPIYLYFNSKIDASIFNHFTISPAINGEWSIHEYYDDSTRIYFSSDVILNFDTEYTITLAGSAKDAAGFLIKEPYQFTFKTVPFQLYNSGYSSYQGPNGYRIKNNFDFDFNAPVDTSTVRASISILPSIDYELSFHSYSNDEYKMIRIDLDSYQILKDTEYTFTFGTAIRSTTGANLKEPFVFIVNMGN
ncbi:MAG: hypothetical protein HND52_14510 [Ignavibacteriae bacterium]|nr:hypothetical protein [Ignavibacteriota bacterium]NOG99166.1 hypothetical protein [Ignavibacteriota bacterium]